ncbi:hypothetical protein MJ547_04525, partial [Burkholderia gladioli]
MNTMTARPSVFPLPAIKAAPATTGRASIGKSASRARAVPVTPIEATGQASTAIVRSERSEPVADWPSAQQSLPNVISRSALFTCTRPEKPGKPEASVTDEYAPRVVNVVVERRIPSMPQYKVTFRGEILNQADAEVWQMALLDAHNAGQMGTPVTFSLNAWCRTLNRTENDPRTNQSIINSLTRLKGATIIVENNETGIVDTVSLIEAFRRDKNTGRCTYSIHPVLATMLRGDTTVVDLWRRARVRSSLAKWMHDFYSTHSDPIPMTLESLHTLSGSSAVMRNFRIRVREAVEELQNCEPPLFAKSTRVENDRLHVVKATNSYFEKPVAAEKRAAPSTTAVEEDVRPAVADKRSAAERNAARQRAFVAL